MCWHFLSGKTLLHDKDMTSTLTWGLSCVACLGPCDRARYVAGRLHLQLHPLSLSGQLLYPWKASHCPVHPHRSHRYPLVSRTPSKGSDYIPETARGWGVKQAWTRPKKRKDAYLVVMSYAWWGCFVKTKQKKTVNYLQIMCQLSCPNLTHSSQKSTFVRGNWFVDTDIKLPEMSHRLSFLKFLSSKEYIWPLR